MDEDWKVDFGCNSSEFPKLAQDALVLMHQDWKVNLRGMFSIPPMLAHDALALEDQNRKVNFGGDVTMPVSFSNLSLFPTFARNFGDDFYLFPMLAVELRVKIWELALPRAPRTVTIDTNRYEFIVTESGPFPSLLHVNVEAREVALRSYRPCFTAVDGRPRYFDFQMDILRILTINTTLLARLPRLDDDLSKVQKLEYHGAILLRSNSQGTFDMHLEPFRGLKTLVVYQLPYVYRPRSQLEDRPRWEELDIFLKGRFERYWEAYTQKLVAAAEGEDFTAPVAHLMPRDYHIKLSRGMSYYTFQ